MPRVFLSLGSNHHRTQNIQAAVKALRQGFGALELSPVFESAPTNQQGAAYYNLVVGMETEMPVTELHEQLRAIEQQQGRDRQTPDCVTIDIDLLLVGQQVRTSKPRIPHTDILQYPHVLIPLALVAGDVIHPTRQQPLHALQQALFPTAILHPVEIPLD